MLDILMYVIIIACVAVMAYQSHNILQQAKRRRDHGKYRHAYVIVIVLTLIWLLYLTAIVCALLNK